MKLLVLLAALLFAGCSVQVAHETENRAQSESLSTSDRSKTGVAVDILNEPTTPHEPETPNANQPPSTERSTTTIKVIVPSPEVVNAPPPAAKRPEPTIHISGSGNTVILGDVHIHHHKHLHINVTPKPTPVRVEVRVELNDRISERERRRRMVERRIAKFFPHYRDGR